MFYLEKGHWNKFPVRLMRVVVYYDIYGFNRDNCRVLAPFFCHMAMKQMDLQKQYVVCLVMPISGPQYN